MSGRKSELEQLRTDLDDLAAHAPAVPLADGAALYKRMRSRRRRLSLVAVSAVVLAVGVGVPIVRQAPWGGQNEPGVSADSAEKPDVAESPTDPPPPIPTESRSPDLDTFDYEGACPDDKRKAGSCPIGARGQKEWQRLVDAFDGSVAIRPIYLGCGGDEEGWGCTFQAYLGDIPYDPRIYLPDGTVVDPSPPGSGQETVASWPQFAFILSAPSGNTGDVSPEVLCQRDDGKLVPFDRCDPNQGGWFEAVRGDGATAVGQFWRIPQGSSLGQSVVTALEAWSEAY